MSRKLTKLAVLLIIVITGAGWMFGIKTKVSNEWKARLSNVQDFNLYAKDHKIEFDDAILEEFSLTGAEFSQAKFINTDWKNTEFKDAKIENTIFEKGEYRNASFSGSLLRNVTFKNITFYSADFGQTELDNVKFIGCNFGRAKFHGLESSAIEFHDSVLEEVRFFDSEVDVKYINSKLTDIGMMGTIAKEYFIVKGSDIYGVDLMESKIPYIEITDSTVKKTTFSSGKSNKLVMKNLKGAMQASGAIIDEIIIDEINTEVLLFAGTHSKSIKVSNVTVTDSFNADAVADFLEITDSNIKSIWNGGSKLETFRIINTELRGTRNESSKIVTFHLENVTLNGIFNFEYTHAENLELINITKGPNYEFLGEGGNIKF